MLPVPLATVDELLTRVAASKAQGAYRMTADFNAVLTVQAGQAHSHANWGWETFTDRVVAQLNAHREGLVFMLWGSHAQKKGAMIDRERHLVLQAPHPSPLSASRGFFGCRHFSQANAWLQQHGQAPIDWQV